MSKQDLVQKIFLWYLNNARDLPWRHTHDPYKILVSEVMLQQTQVDRVVPKYKAFLHEFPDTRQLAQARTADVIKAWKGLGYNRRALFLQRSAQAVQNEYNGVFPQDLRTLLTLPGVGDYTARAVLSFAFDMPVPVLDTNHRKFYRRVFFDGKDVSDKVLLKKAEEIVAYVQTIDITLNGKNCNVANKSSVYHWNQALMDLMSAVVKKDTSELVQTFDSTYAALVPKKKKKKKVIPFRETNRYYRGRIVDMLREQDTVAYADVEKYFTDISKNRLEKILRQLEKDGLVKRAGTQIVFS